MMIETQTNQLRSDRPASTGALTKASRTKVLVNRLKNVQSKTREHMANLPRTALSVPRKALDKVAPKTSKATLPERFTERKLPTPDRYKTARELTQLTLTLEAPLSDELLGYRALYTLDKLPAHHHQGFLRTGDHRTHVQVFQPLKPAVGTVWMLHGYLEHSALYQPMIAELLAQDFAVLTFDLPGHGLSSGEETGIADFSVYQDVLNDIHGWAITQDKHALPRPWLGVGQSTGCAIWMEHALRRCGYKQPPFVERLLLLSPLVRPAKSAWWHNSIGLALIRRIKHSVPRKFRRNNSNPEFLRFVRLNDPLQPRAMAMSWILALSRWMPQMERLPASRFPVWLVQGARDQTVDWRYNNKYVHRKFRVKATVLLEDASHQLVNECDEIRAPLTVLIPVFLKG